MNILVASSRGVGMKERIGKGVPGASLSSSHVMPGGTLNQITDKAIEAIPDTIHTSALPHIYIIAGVPDITHKLKGRQSGRYYTESVYTGDPDNTIQNIKSRIDTCAAAIIRKGAKPIFSTISPINLDKYNNNLLQSGKTCTLKHTYEYPNMQKHIDHIIAQINTHIRLTNRQTGVSTPFTHTAVLKRHGKGRKGYYKPDWGALYDGIHGTDDTKDKWAHTLTTCIQINRGIKSKKRKQSSSDDEVRSPKRAWKHERGKAHSTGHTHTHKNP